MKTCKNLKGIKTAVEVTQIKKHKFSVTETIVTVFIHSDLSDFTFGFCFPFSSVFSHTLDYWPSEAEGKKDQSQICLWEALVIH